MADSDVMMLNVGLRTLRVGVEEENAMSIVAGFDIHVERLLSVQVALRHSLIARPHAPLVPVHVVREVLALVLAEAVHLLRVEVGGHLQELVGQHQTSDGRVEAEAMTSSSK